MAFIRDYGAASSGDPFRFRVPRFIRPPKKVKAALKKAGGFIGRTAVGLLPGGGIAQQIAQSAVGSGAAAFPTDTYIPPAPVMQMPLETAPMEDDAYTQSDYSYPEEWEPIIQFARAYGLIAGDPRGARKQGPPKDKRAIAGAGPAAAAAQKRRARTAKATGTADPRGGAAKRRGAKKPGQPLIMGSDPKINLHKLLVGGANILGQSGIADALTKAHGKDFGGGGGGGKRRRINPTNVHALRHGLARVRSFNKLVHSVRKAARDLRDVAGVTHHTRAPVAARGKR